MDEKISIIMTSYNYAKYIQEAIISVKNQTYTNWELIIIDDTSTDNSLDIIEDYLKDSRIKLVINEKNLGLAASLKKGIDYAEGSWVAFLESDDIFYPTSLEKKMEAAKKGAEVIFTAAEGFQDKIKALTFQKHIEDINKYIVKLDRSKFIDNFKDIMYKTNIIPTFSVVMVKKELLQGLNFNPICKSALDYYLWAQLCFHKFYYIHENLTRWRLHKDSYLNRDKNSWIIKFLFDLTIYAETIKDKNIFLRFLTLINYIRRKLIYISFSGKRLKISLFNNKIIFE